MANNLYQFVCTVNQVRWLTYSEREGAYILTKALLRGTVSYKLDYKTKQIKIKGINASNYAFDEITIYLSSTITNCAGTPNTLPSTITGLCATYSLESNDQENLQCILNCLETCCTTSTVLPDGVADTYTTQHNVPVALNVAANDTPCQNGETTEYRLVPSSESLGSVSAWNVLTGVGVFTPSSTITYNGPSEVGGFSYQLVCIDGALNESIIATVPVTVTINAPALMPILSIDQYSPNAAIDAVGSTGTHIKYSVDKGDTGSRDYQSSCLLNTLGNQTHTAAGYPLEDGDRVFVGVSNNACVTSLEADWLVPNSEPTITMAVPLEERGNLMERYSAVTFNLATSFDTGPTPTTQRNVEIRIKNSVGTDTGFSQTLNNVTTPLQTGIVIDISSVINAGETFTIVTRAYDEIGSEQVPGEDTYMPSLAPLLAGYSNPSDGLIDTAGSVGVDVRIRLDVGDTGLIDYTSPYETNTGSNTIPTTGFTIGDGDLIFVDVTNNGGSTVNTATYLTPDSTINIDDGSDPANVLYTVSGVFDSSLTQRDFQIDVKNGVGTIVGTVNITGTNATPAQQTIDVTAYGITAVDVFSLCSTATDGFGVEITPAQSTYTPSSEAIIINEIDLNNQWFELKNVSALSIDVSNWFICAFPAYEEIQNLTLLSGSLTIPSGGYAAFSWTSIDQSSGELGLYRNNTNFGDAANIRDYVQYNAGSNPRSNVAVTAGVWNAGTSFVTAMTGAGALPIINTNTSATGGSDTGSSNWCIGASATQGTANSACYTPVTPVADNYGPFNEDTVQTVDISTNDPACPGGTRTYSLTGVVIGGAVSSFDPNTGVAEFTPTGSFVGNASFQTEMFCGGVSQGIVTHTLTYVALQAEIQVLDSDDNPIACGTGIQDFSTAVVGATNSRTITIQNLGSTNLSISTFALSGTHPSLFLVNPAMGPQSIVGGGSIDVTIDFSPTSVGAFNATLVMINSDGDETPCIINLTGVGLANPELDVLDPVGSSVACGTATPYDFGTTSIQGPSISETYVIENNGTTNLTVTAINVTGTDAADFVVTAPASFPQTIVPGGTLDVDITFSSTTGGTKVADLNIISNDGDESTCVLPMTGSITVPDIVIQNAATTPFACGALTVSYGNVENSTTSDLTFNIHNDAAATENLDITALNLTGAAAAEFSIVSPVGAFSILPGSTQLVTVRFAPTTTGAKVAAVSIVSDDPDESPCTVNLSGIGVDPPSAAIAWSDPTKQNPDATTMAVTGTKGDTSALDGSVTVNLTFDYIVNGSSTTPTAISGAYGATISGTDISTISSALGIVINPSSTYNNIAYAHPQINGFVAKDADLVSAEEGITKAVRITAQLDEAGVLSSSVQAESHFIKYTWENGDSAGTTGETNGLASLFTGEFQTDDGGGFALGNSAAYISYLNGGGAGGGGPFNHNQYFYYVHSNDNLMIQVDGVLTDFSVHDGIGSSAIAAALEAAEAASATSNGAVSVDADCNGTGSAFVDTGDICSFAYNMPLTTLWAPSGGAAAGAWGGYHELEWTQAVLGNIEMNPAPTPTETVRWIPRIWYR